MKNLGFLYLDLLILAPLTTMGMWNKMVADGLGLKSCVYYHTKY